MNQAFREQVLLGEGERQPLQEACPADLGPQGGGYKYCKWQLGGAAVVVRCAVDAAVRLGDSTQLVAVHALNEFDPKWSGELLGGSGQGVGGVGRRGRRQLPASFLLAGACKRAGVALLLLPAPRHHPAHPFRATRRLLPLPAGVDWRQKLENQRGAVLATELKNNANKIAKWTAAALVT